MVEGWIFQHQHHERLNPLELLNGIRLDRGEPVLVGAAARRPPRLPDHLSQPSETFRVPATSLSDTLDALPRKKIPKPLADVLQHRHSSEGVRNARPLSPHIPATVMT